MPSKKTKSKRPVVRRTSPTSCSAHKFTVSVKKRDCLLAGPSRKDAELALLYCFSVRRPDGYEFNLHRKKPNPVVRGATKSRTSPPRCSQEDSK